MDTDPAAAPETPPPARYCVECGEIFTPADRHCPNCGIAWSSQPYVTVRMLATLLPEFRGLHDAGVIGPNCYAALRGVYERRLTAIRPARALTARPAISPPLDEHASAPEGPPPTVALPPEQEETEWSAAAQRRQRPPVTGGTPGYSPPRPVPAGPSFAERLGAWTAARQADITLYLGAFLLSIAALTFVGYQGDTMSGPGRFALLAVYTGAFIALGFVLPRWERVREAGAVFLALGAVLTPINFIALRTQALGADTLPADVVWLLGGLVTAGLYFSLAARGHGRWYELPGAAAVVISWGALGAVLNLPAEWFGAWFAAGAALLYTVTLTAEFPGVRWAEYLAWALAPGALLYAHTFALSGATDRAQLPATYLLITAAAAFGVYRRRGRGMIALLPVLGSLVALTGCWSALDLAPEWFTLFLSTAALGYLVVAHLDSDQQQMLRRWRAVAVLFSGAALLVAHMVASTPDVSPAPLPAVYLLILIGVAAAYLRFRWTEALAVLPLVAAGLAASSAWAAWSIHSGWYAAFIAAAALGYLIIAEFDAGPQAMGNGQRATRAEEPAAGNRQRAAKTSRPGRRRGWCNAAAGLGLVALLVGHLTVAERGGARFALPVTDALMLAGALAGALRFRRIDYLTAVPPLSAALGAAVGWSGWQMSQQWLGAWAAAATLGYLALAEVRAREIESATDGRPTRLLRWSLPLGPWSLPLGPRRPGLERRFRLGALVMAAIGVTAAHGVASLPDPHLIALPLTWGIVLVAVLWDGARRRDAGLLALPFTGAMFAGSVLWAAAVPVEWYIYPGLAAALLILLSEPWWRGRPVLGAAGWPYLLLPALLLPLLFAERFLDRPAHGLISFGIAAVLLLAGALRAGRRVIVPVVRRKRSSGARVFERVLLARLSSAYLYVAAGYFNGLVGAEGSDRAWVFAGISAAAWLGLAAAGVLRSAVTGRDDATATTGDALRSHLFGVLAPAGVIATLVAAWLTRGDSGHAATVLALGAAGPALAFAATRRWSLSLVATAFGLAALAAAWDWRDRPAADLPAAFGLVALTLWGALLPLRRYERDERGVSITTLSWAVWLPALSLALLLLGNRLDSLPESVSAARTREWAVLAITVTAAALTVLMEGLRLRQRMVANAGTAGLVAALLLAIAITEPASVQAYTLPVGLYLIGLGLTYRRSPEFFGPNMHGHEALITLGVLFMAVPPAMQSFEPGGDRFGLELIAFGFLFLAAGFALTARWLAAGGVVTLSAVALRWLLEAGSQAPYWLTLGLAGMALLGIGVLLLFERDWWDRTRHKLGRWWLSADA